ncbi:MAG: GatB/YqeY domain-containing protein, partial [Armatimonadota bacterium]|nr:GatB/YqeY domain-containing protein [Armatimonadota bacterium]
AIEGFQRGGREDLIQKESLEMAILLGYLPQPLTEDEIRAVVEEIAATAGAATEREFGRVMGSVMKRVAGRAEGKTVERIVRDVLRR